MRRVVVALVIAAGCYGPRAPAGAPCDPEIGNCPGDQVCRAEAGEFRCGAPLALDGAPIDTAGDAPIPDGPSGTLRVVYAATVAECASPMIVEPSYCRSVNGDAQLAVDEKDTMTEHPWFAFVRFDLDDAIAGKQVNEVTLRAVASDDGKAGGPNSGDVWRVSAFSLQTLKLNQLPAKQGTSKLAGTQGAVVQLQAVEWPLAIGIVEAGKPVYLGIYLTTSDGVTYWNTDGPDPPQLIIDVEGP